MAYESRNMKSENAVVTISKNRLEAYLYLCPPMDQEVMTEEINTILKKNNIIYGIKEEVIRDIVVNKRYYEEILIAVGTKSIDGADGHYEYLFNTNFNSKPHLLDDGSVDYHSLKLFESVSKGQVIVQYTLATKGTNGTDVQGESIKARRGKELPRLLGMNFSLSEDRTTYTSNVDGKIDYINDVITITDVFEINGDIDITNGDIDFKGDVWVKGNVEAGMTLKATGNVFVNGYVETANIYAGKDVILKNGMQGGGKGIIIANGSVSGKFFEQVEIKALGNVNANAIMNCNITSDGEVLVSGKYGIIVGGCIKASEGITATSIGNMSEIKTVLNVGTSNLLYKKLDSVVNEIKNIHYELLKIDEAVKKINDYIEKVSNATELEMKKVQLMHTKIAKNGQLMNLNLEKDDLIESIKVASRAKVIVRKNIFSGTKVIICGEVLHITELNRNVSIVRDGIEVYIESNEVDEKKN